MNENNQMQNHNDEIEIDLRELWQELKKNIMLIAGVTTAFVVAAAVYSFVIAKPVYEYNAMIRIPNGVSGAQINNFVEIFKDDIKNCTSWMKPWFCVQLIYPDVLIWYLMQNLQQIRLDILILRWLRNFSMQYHTKQV